MQHLSGQRKIKSIPGLSYLSAELIVITAEG